MIKISKLIKTIRNNNDFSQQELADRLEVTKTYICLIEKEKKEPSFTLIKKLSTEFNFPLWLLIWDEFAVGDESTTADKKLKKEIDKMIPAIKDYFFEKISGVKTV